MKFEQRLPQRVTDRSQTDIRLDRAELHDNVITHLKVAADQADLLASLLDHPRFDSVHYCSCLCDTIDDLLEALGKAVTEHSLYEGRTDPYSITIDLAETLAGQLSDFKYYIGEYSSILHPSATERAGTADDYALKDVPRLEPHHPDFFLVSFPADKASDHCLRSVCSLTPTLTNFQTAALSLSA